MNIPEEDPTIIPELEAEVVDPAQAHAQGVALASEYGSPQAGLGDFYLAYTFAPENPLYAADLALALDESGRSEEARKVVMSMSGDKQDILEWGFSGIEFHRIALAFTQIVHDEQRACELFTKACAEDPEHLELQISLAISLAALGYEDEAYAVTEKAVSQIGDGELSDYEASQLARLANLVCISDPSWADILAQRALDVLPDDPGVLREAGVVSIKNNDFKEAVERFRKGTEIAPDYELVWGGLQYSLFSLGLLEDAFRVGRKLLEKWPDSEEARFNTASAALNLGWRDEAAEEFEELLSILPDDAIAHMGLGTCHALAGKADEARHHQQKGLELGGDDPEVQRLSAEIDRILDSGPEPSNEEIKALLLLMLASVMNRPKNGYRK